MLSIDCFDYYLILNLESDSVIVNCDGRFTESAFLEFPLHSDAESSCSDLLIMGAKMMNMIRMSKIASRNTIMVLTRTPRAARISLTSTSATTAPKKKTVRRGMKMKMA